MDCLEGMKMIPDGSVDCIITDLPYGTTYSEFDKMLKNNKRVLSYNIIDLEILWKQFKRIIKPDGAICLFACQPFTTTLISSNIEWYKYSWIWIKNKAANHVAIKYQPLKITEEICVFSNAGVNTKSLVPLKYNPLGVVWKKEKRHRKNDVTKTGVFRYNNLKAGDYEINGTNYPTNVLEYAVPSGDDRLHPTQKPVDLLRYLVLTYTNPGDLVLDATIGSGTTAIACIKERRHFIGFELNREYFDKAVERINRERQQPALDFATE
jgi:site-specific DNA-methyltransferase (adenine-specific)